MKELKAIPWIERARATRQYHSEQKKKDFKWRVSDTAACLNRSIGSISEDLLIAKWLKTHEEEIRKFETAREALTFVKELERALEME